MYLAGSEGSVTISVLKVDFGLYTIPLALKVLVPRGNKRVVTLAKGAEA